MAFEWLRFIVTKDKKHTHPGSTSQVKRVPKCDILFNFLTWVCEVEPAYDFETNPYGEKRKSTSTSNVYEQDKICRCFLIDPKNQQQFP